MTGVRSTSCLSDMLFMNTRESGARAGRQGRAHLHLHQVPRAPVVRADHVHRQLPPRRRPARLCGASTLSRSVATGSRLSTTIAVLKGAWSIGKRATFHVHSNMPGICQDAAHHPAVRPGFRSATHCTAQGSGRARPLVVRGRQRLQRGQRVLRRRRAHDLVDLHRPPGAFGRALTPAAALFWAPSAARQGQRGPMQPAPAQGAGARAPRPGGRRTWLRRMSAQEKMM